MADFIICGISKQDLLDYKRFGKKVEELKKRIKKGLKDNEGKPIDFGSIVAKEVSRSSRRPAWKDEITKLIGSEGVEQIIENTPEKISVSFRVDKK